jgi:ABC-type nitrate/sulfonate/bicarbonate transport system substrate-binding protein
VSFVFSFGYSGHRAPYVLADAAGFFEDEGLNVEVTEGTGSTDALDALATDRVDFAELEFSTVATGQAQGREVITVATTLQRAPYCIAGRTEDGIGEPQDLAGKSIVAIPGSSDTALLEPLFVRNGVDPSSVEIINGDFQTRNTIFLSGEADSMPTFANDTYVRLLEQGNDLTCFLSADFGLPLLGNGVAVTKEFAEANPNTVAAFVRAVKRAWEYSEEHPQEAIDALLEVAPLLVNDEELAVLDATWDFTHSDATEENGWGYTSPDDVEAGLELLVEAGLLESAGDSAQYVDNSFLVGE